MVDDVTNKFISSVWEFDNSGRHSVHDVVRWYGRLPQQLVRRIIPLYTKPGDLVMANFAGSGTVLVESNLTGRRAYGTDIHPLSILANTVKINRYVPSDIGRFLGSLDQKAPRPKNLSLKQHKWFDSKDLSSMAAISASIARLKSAQKRDFYKLALANIVRGVSRVDSRCVNHLVVDKNKQSRDVMSEFSREVYRMHECVTAFKKTATQTDMAVRMSDARSLELDDGAVDLMIAHPPYANAILYYNIYSLVTDLLGYDYDAIRKSDLSSGPFDLFLSNMRLVLKESFRVIRSGGYQVFIIGDVRRNGDLVTALPNIIEMSRDTGFRLEDIFIWKLKHKAGMGVARRGNHIDHNYLLVMQKK